MSATMRKAVGEIVTRLKKLPEPGKKNGSFWDFMKSQLMTEGEWDQKHIKTIEKEIDSYIAKVDKKSLIEMWKATPNGEEKYDDDMKLNVKEMKEDITDEMVGQVMDRMDDNYNSRDSGFTAPPETYAANEKTKKSGDETEESEEEELGDFKDDEIDLDDDLFNDDSDDDEDFRF